VKKPFKGNGGGGNSNAKPGFIGAGIHELSNAVLQHLQMQNPPPPQLQYDQASDGGRFSNIDSLDYRQQSQNGNQHFQ
jgi:hypothetical protein